MRLRLVCGWTVLFLVTGLTHIDVVERVQAQVPPTCPPSNVIPIGTLQGAVPGDANGRTHRSSFAPPSGNSAGTATVRVQGVIYQRTQARTSSGGIQHGFFVQNTAATADGNADSSDGVFVFIGGFTTVLNATPGGPTYTPRVGDEIVLQGRVTEFFFLTEITSPRWVCTVRTNVGIDAEVAPFEVNPPDVLADADRYWERREGMRALVPANSLVVGRRDVFVSTMDGEIWVIRPDHPVANRTDLSARRVFRDPHPLDDLDESSLFDNGNGYRIMMGSLGIKATMNDRDALIGPARTFDRVGIAVDGGVYFAFDKYSVQIRQQVTLIPGLDPSASAPVPSYAPATEYRVVTYNVENLYDFRDDPFDGCDFAGNAGCPGVNPPFDYVPADEGEYRDHLDEIADQVDEMGAPDIILIQEAEDQDICASNGRRLVCGSKDHRDGLPDTLQDLALVISRKGGPVYEAVADRDGADDRGIISAFMFRTDRVQLLEANPSDPVLGSSPTVVYRAAGLGYNADVQNPKVLNAPLPADVDNSTGQDGNLVYTRPPQIGLFRVWQGGIGDGIFIDLYMLSNHFSSTPDRRVGQRREQAAYAAAIVEALRSAGRGQRVIVGGDLNVYPRPDDPFTPGHSLFPSDQLAALYDAGLENLWDRLRATRPSAAYSYVFQGQTQTLDQMFVTDALDDELVRVWAAHMNSDWPQDHRGDRARGTSDHDPQGADFRFVAP